MQPEKMVMMINQIATYFSTQPGTDQALRIADHINDFWEPRMRIKLADHAKAGGKGLSALALAACAHIRAPAPCSSQTR
ncbi:formate dehydrogenase subunit delta [Pseudorhodobacter sp.]|jgi:formate dehydrogenase subunit delta|uniref:formate dehydrogenase subunit delta n=1 Tax=Pseudorhodobacter sp. TaxID=1934400 RepID=UPI0011D5DFBA|nr:formate dehydrogenase subunit delta [Pseudorhodobacter sp.]MBP9951555.1 formate dehydrogenase subunit delta [Cypionkella sp.]TXG94163.1 MAG: formate dehydrogenase [Rhodocyclaceae bacterium]